MSTVAKIFSTILNNRITNQLDDNRLLCNEQNGFRKLRSCLDHIYTLTSIVRNRKLQKLPKLTGISIAVVVTMVDPHHYKPDQIPTQNYREKASPSLGDLILMILIIGEATSIQNLI